MYDLGKEDDLHDRRTGRKGGISWKSRIEPRKEKRRTLTEAEIKNTAPSVKGNGTRPTEIIIEIDSKTSGPAGKSASQLRTTS